MSSEPCKVLVVDDNRDAADSAVLLLEAWGHKAVAVYSGADCITTAQTFDPDVVLMDIGLPGTDGFRVKEELDRCCPGVRVVALTGYTQAHIIRRTRETGFADRLVKPVELTELKATVKRECEIAKAL